ncbi:transcriptional regulator [Lentzea rhizosphaerae]|uniref:Transcriptional regulator n=1 Tax=Lentzea rhizosphaerae TaxID=2041025 RepID=A0ABV8BM54_9PSEU
MATPDFLPGAERAPRRISLSDVERLEAETDALRLMDYRLGGGASLAAVRTRMGDGRLMLEASAAEYVQRRLHVALGDLYNLAGWVSFDVGLVGSAHVHFAEALIHAGWGRSNSLVANICYRLGRVCLHHGSLDEALDHFELGRLAAAGPGDEIAASILSVNAAWTHARKGDGAQTLADLDRGRSHFAAADHTAVPSWARFFTETDLSAVTGAVHTDLALTVNPHHTRNAIPLLTEAVGDYGDDMARSRAFSLILLSINHLLDRDLDQGVAVGFRALASAEQLASARVRDRIRPLGEHAEQHRSHAGARELATCVAAHVGTPAGPR